MREEVAVKDPMPTRVDDIEAYWTEAPPEESSRCRMWRERIATGWRPNKRVSKMGYYESAAFYGVYIWEYINVISGLVR